MTIDPVRSDQRRLEIPRDVAANAEALELITVWFSDNRAKIITRTGTGLDTSPAIWGEILAGVAGNVALSLEQITGRNPSSTLTAIKDTLDQHWPGR